MYQRAEICLGIRIGHEPSIIHPFCPYDYIHWQGNWTVTYCTWLWFHNQVAELSIEVCSILICLFPCRVLSALSTRVHSLFKFREKKQTLKVHQGLCMRGTYTKRLQILHFIALLHCCIFMSPTPLYFSIIKWLTLPIPRSWAANPSACFCSCCDNTAKELTLVFLGGSIVMSAIYITPCCEHAVSEEG